MPSTRPSSALRAALVYAGASFVWIFVSDRFAEAFGGRHLPLGILHTIKGTGFVLVTTLLLYAVLRRQLRARAGETEVRRKAEAALRQSEAHYRFLFDNMLEGFALCRVIVEEGQPIDFDHVEVNRTFGELTGLQDVVGRRVSEVIPNIQQSNTRFLQAFARVAAGGSPERIEEYLPALRAWLAISLYSPRPGYCAAIFTNVTERKRAEEALARQNAQLGESEARYRSLVAYSNDAVLLTVPDGEILAANEAACTMFGMTEAELCASPRGLLVDESDPRLPVLCAERIRTGQARGELVFIRKDGTRFPGELASTLFIDKDGQVRTSMTIRDVSEQRRMVEALRASEEQFRAVFDMASVGLAQADPRTGQLVRVNERMCAITGYSADELLAMRVSEITHPDDRQRDWEAFQGVVRGDAPSYQIEKRYVRQNGTVAWVNVNMTVLRNGDGSPTWTIGVVEDITERRRAADALREEAERRRVLFDQSRDGIVVLTEDGRAYEANRQFAAMLGYTPGEVLQLYAWDWDARWNRDDILEMLQRVTSEGVYMETEFRRQDGTVLEVEFSSSGQQWAGRKLIFCVCRDVSRRKQAERALLESEERYRRLFDQASEGIALADAESGIMIDCNGAFLRMVGYPREEVIGISQAALHPEHVCGSGLSRSFELHRGPRAGEILEDVILTKSGEIREVEITADALEIAGRRTLLAFFRDVTVEHRARSEREMTLDLLKLLGERGSLHEMIRAITELIHTWTGCEAVGIRMRDGDDFPYFETRGFDPEFVVMENHLCVRDLDGMIQRDEIGNPVLDCMCGNVLCGRFDASKPFFTPKGSFWSNGTTQLLASTSDADRQARTRNRCNGEGYESVGLFIIRYGDRTLGLLQVNDRRTNRFTPELIAFIEKTTDQIALALAQRQAEEALHESERLYRDLVENAAETIMVIQNGTIRFVNQEGVSLSGYSREELMARSFLDFVYPEDRSRVAGNHERRLRGEQVIDGEETRFVHKDGAVRTVQIKAARIAWKGAPATLNFLRDITEMKNAADEHKRMEAELQQTRRMEAIGQLAGGIAHDFNNLLTVIQGNSSMVLAGMLPGDPHHDLIGDIHDAGERASALTRQLLAFSRKQVLEPRVLDPNAIVANLQRMLRRLIGENISLMTELSPAIGTVLVDLGQIEQVLINLVVNARDAMPGGGQVAVSTDEVLLDEEFCRQHPGSQPGRFVRISVSDTGTGMPPEVLERVFEPFFTTKGVSKGTGLGLATVFGIVKQSDGFVLAESTVGVGSRFTVHLPVTGRASALSHAPTGSASPLRGGTETILLVEDEQSVRRVVSRALRTWGFRVVEAEDGEAAIAIMQGEQAGANIDLLVTDMVMPRLGGRELAERLRAIFPELRVLFMSGYTDEALLQSNLAVPRTAFVRKPFPLPDLVRKVRNLLDNTE